jgi:hypothetical protein
MKPLFSRGEKISAWFLALVFLSAAIWGAMCEPTANPIPGLRDFSENPWAAWPSTVLVFYISFVISFPRQQSAPRLYFLSGFSACAWFALAAFVSSGGSIGLAFLSGMLYRAAEKHG